MADDNDLVGIAAHIVASYVERNSLSVHELPGIIQNVYGALAGLESGMAPAAAEEPLRPAVSIKKSITPDFIICLEDGKPFKSMRRHLNTKYGMTPEAYRAKWGLPRDYPMTAPNYTKTRSELALKIGLGAKGRVAKAKPAAAKPAAKAKAAPKAKAAKK